jgi:hypothetical protein
MNINQATNKPKKDAFFGAVLGAIQRITGKITPGIMSSFFQVLAPPSHPASAPTIKHILLKQDDR